MNHTLSNPWLILGCIVAAVPLAGFGCGVAICSDCGSNPFDYLLIGLVHAVLSTIGLGRCYSSAASSINLWPYIVVIAITLWLAVGYLRRRRAKP